MNHIERLLAQNPVLDKAERLAKELDSGEFPEDLEPQFVAWLLRSMRTVILSYDYVPDPRPLCPVGRDPKEYLGDSVYVEFDEAGQLVLTTENGLPNDPSNTIVLEDSVYTALVNYVTRMGDLMS